MYIADLHIHSRYSRATSKDCTPEHLDLWARRKGIRLVGTGDFTHPAWREELAEKLEPAEGGLYRLKEEYRIQDGSVAGAQEPRFVVTGEISSIYKKKDKVRKVHSLILLPGLEEAETISRKLEAIGNIHSDGRPILGLDCHDLLEILLELCPESIYVPAHIWTPHFSLFGAFSGFDSVEECFGDLSGHIHAIETGLSSDPPMNWQVSALDKYQLISNSDAHSPAKLGREANLLTAELSYEGLRAAIETGEGLYGTIEFFPEEGKYHYDGHRKCGLCLSPAQSDSYHGICPVCQKKLTIGVSHRVAQLADRPEGSVRENAKPFESLVPLPEVIGSALGHSSASRGVQREYERLLKALGPEFSILRELPTEEIRAVSGSLIAEGIERLRRGEVQRNPGYDGEYGTVQLFTREELENPDGQMSLFDGEMLPEPEEQKAEKVAVEDNIETPSRNRSKKASENQGQENPEQEAAITSRSRVTIVEAGPGTGKTRTLIAHIVHLVEERGAAPSQITAVTFTNRAAAEMRERLEQSLGAEQARRVQVGTFHTAALNALRAQGFQGVLAGEMELRDLAGEFLEEAELSWETGEFLERVSRYKTGGAKFASRYQTGEPEALSPEEAQAFEAWQARMRETQLVDFDDILVEALRASEEGSLEKERFAFLLVDEFQDVNPLQYRLIRAWNRDGQELFVIGDRDQAIYSFRGADARCFDRLLEEEEDAAVIRLKKNYRSSPQILAAATQVISENPGAQRKLEAITGAGEKPRLFQAQGRMEEAVFVAKEIGRLTGGIGMLEAQEVFVSSAGKSRGFGEIAVLYRTHHQAELLETCLKKEGIPYVVAGREDYLMDRNVAGTVEFFRSLLEPNNQPVRERAMRHLLKLAKGKLTETIYETLAEKYRPLAEKEPPRRALELWAEEFSLGAKKPVRKLLCAAAFYDTMREFLDALETGVESDIRRCGGREYEADAVTLMTLHGAKGLEFPAVLLYGVKEGTIPWESRQHPADVEEERRLLYVGMTRAREELILTCSGEESEFLEALKEPVLEREESGRKRQQETGRQMELSDFLR